jgi:hypothetical protein
VNVHGDRDALLRDYAEGKISADKTLRDYGVNVEGGTP